MTVFDPWRALALAASAFLVVGLVACAGPGASEPKQPNASAEPDAPTDAAGEASALSGLYLPSDVAVVDRGDTIILASTRPCDDVAAMLDAGQWTVVESLSYTSLGEEAAELLSGFGAVPGSLIRRGDRLAFATLDGGASCTATVGPLSRGEITLDGPGLPGPVTGWVATTRCYESASTGDITASVYFDTDAGIGGQGQFVLTRSGDRYTVTAGEDAGLTMTLLRHEGAFLDALARAYAATTEPPFIPLEPGDAPGGEASVERAAADAPPHGAVVLTGLVDARTWEGESSVGFPFSCPTVIRSA